MSDGSITHCLRLLRCGDAEAAGVIWRRYFPRLVRLARKKLAATVCRAADGEDVALSALDRFCRAARQGQFPDLADRDGLWRLLLRITWHRALDLARRERRQRRGGGGAGGERLKELDEIEERLSDLASGEPSAEFAAQFADECRRLLDRLDEPGLQALAIAKMEGYSNLEIAGRLGCSVRTVERRLRLIRDLWRDREPV